jgi:23S rRNA G2069 N7-methylase RlmK/C1962 C5-methylase RlmI
MIIKAMQNQERTAYQAELLYNRIKKRARHLKKWARRIGTDAFRLYDRDIPEIPLLIDFYKDAVSGALFERPYEKDEAEEMHWLSAMTEALSGALAIPSDRIFLKIRKRQRRDSQYDRLVHQNFFVDVREEGLTFRVNLSDYLDTGLFLDRRRLRSMLRKEVTGKKVLNLFCYTATFSVYAAAGGASVVDSVDMSNTYLNWGETNFALNGLKTALVRPETLFDPAVPFRFIRTDVLSFLDHAANTQSRWDIIVLDPPTFSNSKSMTSTLDVNRDYQSIISQCLALLNVDGKLYFSTNAQHFHLDADEFPTPPLNITDRLHDEDFLGKKVPKCWLFSL